MNRAGEAGHGKIEVHTKYDWSTTTPSDAVVDAVLKVASDGPTSFGPLYDHIDPDALDSIFRVDEKKAVTDQMRASFLFADRLVVVHGTGEVVVRTAPAEGGSD